MTIYDGSARELACDLFDRALGYRVVVGRSAFRLRPCEYGG